MIRLFPISSRGTEVISVMAAGLFAYGCMPVVEEQVSDRPATVSEVAPLTVDGVAVTALSQEGVLRVDDFRGRVVLIDFWATWSAPSRHELPDLARLHKELEDEGFTVIGLCMDVGERDEVLQRVETFGLPYPVGRADETVMNAYGGVRVAPTKVLLDQEGRIRKTYEGVASIDQLRADIAPLLAR